MKDQNKTEEQLMDELMGLRQRIAHLEEQKQDEEQPWTPGAVSEAINMALLETLACETEEEVANVCLAVAEELTDSKFGYIGEVNREGRFDTIAISDTGWERCKIPESDALILLKDMEIRGVWGRGGITIRRRNYKKVLSV